MIKQSAKYFLFLFILCFLLINISQDFFKLKLAQKPLQGYFEPSLKDTFSLSKWANGSFAEKTGNYLNEQFGFRNFYVRLNNQLRFLLFKKSNVKDFLIGKENYLYQQGYINEYNGDYFSGENVVNDTVLKLKQLQDGLKSRGKNLLIVIAPSKARIYPEYIPNHFRKGPTENCHYAAYTKAFFKQGINFIDFNNWHLQKKEKSKYLLIPQFGVHWSRLEAVLAADTMIKYISHLSGNKLPQIKIKNLIEKDTLESPDEDAVRSMNLFWMPSYKKMAYPEYEIINNPESNLLVISDSYWWDIYDRRIPEKVFRQNEFWYYNKEMYGNMYLGKTNVEDFDVKRHILQYDNILIVCAESNLRNFGFGFISSALKELKKEIKPTPSEINDYKEAILANADWLKQITEKARQRNKSVDEMMLEDINWLFQQKGPMFKEPSVEEAVERIKNDAGWLQQIKQQATKSGRNLDSVILDNARYVIFERTRNK